MIDPSEIQRLRDQTDIVGVAAAYTTLEQRSGGDFWGCCPLHSETSPSFHVVRDEKYFKCFGCGNGGDVIDLLIAAENLTFPQAVERLSGAGREYSIDEKSRAGVEARKQRRAARALPTGEASPPNIKSLGERGHDEVFLLREFGVKTCREEWSGEYWQYPTHDENGAPMRTRRKFRDKSVSGKKYHFFPGDKRPEPCGYPLEKIVDGACEELWLVNGEPSVWLCWQENVPAVCTLSESSYKRLPDLMEILKARGVRLLHILLDNDTAGREGTRRATLAAIDAGYALITSDEPAMIPSDGLFVIPHIWHPSPDFPRGYDVADLHQNGDERALYVKLHATHRAPRAEIVDDAPPEVSTPSDPEIVGLDAFERDTLAAQEYLAARKLEENPPPDNVLHGDFSRRDEYEEVGERDGNTVRKRQVKTEAKATEKGVGSRKNYPAHTQYEILMEWLEKLPKVRTPNKQGFVLAEQTFAGQKHTVPLLIGGDEFADFLSVGVEEKKMILKADAEKMLVKRLGGLARTEGRLQELYLRVAGGVRDNGGGPRECVYVDLGDEARRVVEIDGAGWRIISGGETQELPVMFRRAGGMEAMPLPIAPENDDDRAATWDIFREILMPGDDANWIKMVAWVLQCFRKPVTPYLGLCVTGQQNSGKTVRTRMLRMLVDPHKMRLVSSLRKEEDFESIANGTFVMGFENLSKISDELSDKFCQVATDGRFVGRVLHTTMDTYIIKALRPLLLNGITDFVQRPDLKRRFLFVDVPPFTGDMKPRSDIEVFADFAALLPKLLGVVFDAVAASLKHAGDDDIRELEWGGGIIDFGRAMAAAEKGGALPWQTPGTFRMAYLQNIQDATEAAIAGSPSAAAVVELVKDMERREVLPEAGAIFPPDDFYNRLTDFAAWSFLDRTTILCSTWMDNIGGQRYEVKLFGDEQREELKDASIVEIMKVMRDDAHRHYDKMARQKLERTTWPTKIGLGRWLKRDASQLLAVGIDLRTPTGGERAYIVRRMNELEMIENSSIFDDEE